jgi:uncharacterized membrane protein YdbT with pleckstrin-like domain
MSASTQPHSPWDLLPSAPSKPTWTERLWASRQMRLEKTGEITWRRHWLFLARRMIGPFVYLLVGAVIIVVTERTIGLFKSLWSWWLLSLLVVIAPATFWAWWEYAVWGGDIYTLTEERIIDIERLPLGLREKRRESQLDRIQDIDVDIPNILARIFNMGNVKIKTGAAGSDLTFLGVFDPYGVQRDIFHRLAQLRRKQTERQRSQHFQEMIRWFKEYDNLPSKGSMQGGGEDTAFQS